MKAHNQLEAEHRDILFHYNSNIIQFFLIGLFYFFAFFTPKVYFGGIHFRYEDLLTFFIATILIFNLRKNYVLITSLIFVYSFYIIFFSMLNIMLENSNLYSIVILGKEVQYFLVFSLILFSFDNVSFEKSIKYFFTPITFIVVLFALNSMINGNIGAYGLPYINENAPSTSAISYFNFLFITIILYFFYSPRSKLISKLLLLSIGILLISLIATASRTAFLVVVLFMVISPLFFLNTKYSIPIFLFIIMLIFIVYFNRYGLHEYLYLHKPENPVFHVTIGRVKTLLLLFDNLEVLHGARINSWQQSLSHINNWNIFFGNGRGYFSATDGFKGLGTDSQFTRNIIEIGIIGSFIFIMVILSPILYLKDIWKNIYILYLILYLFWSIAAEIFLVSKGGEMFWLITAILLLLSNKDYKDKEINDSFRNSNL
tara:strand:+ start:56 stop:1342 length:1287 start_codon:yes stop_codon:yes gene_type:complete